MSNHPNITSNGVSYSFHHLQSHRINLPDIGKSGNPIICRVHYSTHVYSKRMQPGATEYCFQDRNGQDREFCPIRFAQSQNLPNIVSNLTNNAGVSKDTRGVTNLLTVPGRVAGIFYGVFFHLVPSTEKDIDVEMYIRSAYEVNSNQQNVKKNTLKYYIKKCHFEDTPIP